MGIIEQLRAIETCQREAVEDTLEAVNSHMKTWHREGRIAADVEPLVATREGNTIMVWLSNDDVGIILMDTPDRSTLNGV